MQFRVAGSERVRIDTSGNVGIGTTSPATRLDIQGAGGGATSPIVTATTGTNYIGWKSTNTGGSFWTAIDNSTGSSFSTGTAYARVLWSNGAYPMVFSTNSTERLRIDSSGNLLVGTTDTTLYSATSGGGVLLDPNGPTTIARSAGVALYINRTTSDGALQEFRKDGTTVGSIGAFSSRLFIGSGDTGIFFDSITDDAIKPWNISTNAGRDALIDLGSSGARFKDLYLSGNASVGSLSTPTAGTSNFVAGVNAGNSITSGGNYNVVVGDEAGTAITTGDRNAFVGYKAGDSTTTASYNTAMGSYALDANTTGTNNTAVGDASLDANTSGSNNVAIGQASLTSNTTASNNTAVGFQSLFANTEGTENTAVGTAALSSTITGSYNTAVGRSAALLTTGDFNTTVGRNSLRTNSSGSYNTAVGSSALYQNTTAAYNTAVGFSALFNNTTGQQNVAVGGDALDANTTGGDNVAIGTAALGQNTTASNNTAVGTNALTANTTGSENTAVGKSAGSLVTTGGDNTFVGNQAGDTVTEGQQLTIIGGYSDANATIQNATAIGYNTNVTATNNIFLGNTSVSAIKGQVSFSTYSDERIKKDIKDTDLGLEFIKELKPRKYKRVAPKDYPEEFKDPNKDDLNNPDYIVDGLVAQEVKQTMDKLDVSFSGWDEDENTTKQSLEYPAFVPALIKAIQELSTQVDELKSELLALKGV
jgi:hypothetical protein